MARAGAPHGATVAASDTAITSKSIAFFERRLAQDPDNFMIGGQLVRRAVAWNPRNEDALGLLFDASVATGRYPLVEATLRRLTPGRLSYQLRLAHFLTAQGRMDGAYHAMDHACRQLARAQVRPQAVAWCLTELAKIQQRPPRRLARAGSWPAR